MSSVVQEIQAIHALRKNIRDLTIAPALLKSIESIHHSIHSSAEQNGWKTVDLCGPARAPRDNGRSHERRDQQGGNRLERVDRSKHETPTMSNGPDLFEPQVSRMHASHALQTQDHPVATYGFRAPFHQQLQTRSSIYFNNNRNVIEIVLHRSWV
jgi:hypothetical protein